VAHTVGAAGVGAQSAIVFGDAFVGIASGILTILILVFSEIVPKTIGTLYWRQLTPAVIRVLAPILWLMWPLVKMAEWLRKLLARGKGTLLVKREEFIALAELGAREGVINTDESRILTNLFKFDQLRVSDIMTPRTVVFCLAESLTVAEVMAKHEKIMFSRIPLIGTSADDITGFVLKSDILKHGASSNPDITLFELKRPLPFVAEDVKLGDLLKEMSQDNSQIAIAIGEFGDMAGVVTMEDIVETLLGIEIVDEGDPIQDMRVLARSQWQKRAERLGILTLTKRDSDVIE
jgi:CBS domain containing-hemolysin-like protein